MKGKVVALCLVTALLGCGGPSEKDKKQDSVKLMLNWFPEAEHGGYFTAQVEEFYRQEGVNVEIIPGGEQAHVVSQVGTGRVDFGVENADAILMGRARGVPVVALMAPLQ